MKGSDVASEVTIDFISAIKGAELRSAFKTVETRSKVRVPSGAGDGDKVRIPGHGQPGPFGGPPGDLILNIRVQPHPFFERSGLDLYLDLPVSLGEAYHGSKVRVPTPDGPVTLSVPKQAQSGQVARLKGRGVKRKNDQGDLFVRFLVRYPESSEPRGREGDRRAVARAWTRTSSARRSSSERAPRVYSASATIARCRAGGSRGARSSRARSSMAEAAFKRPALSS